MTGGFLAVTMHQGGECPRCVAGDLRAAGKGFFVTLEPLAGWPARTGTDRVR